ncbi:hypothetical protein ACFWAR_04485 [Streptomyces sp. NPDC059917]
MVQGDDGTGVQVGGGLADRTPGRQGDDALYLWVRRRAQRRAAPVQEE